MILLPVKIAGILPALPGICVRYGRQSEIFSMKNLESIPTKTDRMIQKLYKGCYTPIGRHKESKIIERWA
jgi:hypothetical protein